jgi:hypothetical protein
MSMAFVLLLCHLLAFFQQLLDIPELTPPAVLSNHKSQCGVDQACFFVIRLLACRSCWTHPTATAPRRCPHTNRTQSSAQHTRSSYASRQKNTRRWTDKLSHGLMQGGCPCCQRLLLSSSIVQAGNEWRQALAQRWWPATMHATCFVAVE